MAVPAPKVASLQARAESQEEYTQIVLPPVSLPTRRCFAAVHDRVEGKRVVELLALNSEGKPIHFAHDPESETGWSDTPIPVADPPEAEVREITGFFSGKRLIALIRWAGSPAPTRAMVRTAGGQWSALPLSKPAAALLANTRNAAVVGNDAGEGFLYGVSADHRFFLLAPSGGQWEVALTEKVVGNDRYFVLPGKEADDLTILRGHNDDDPKYSLRFGKVAGGSFQGTPEKQIRFSLPKGAQIDSIQAFSRQPDEVAGRFHWLVRPSDSVEPVYMFVNEKLKVSLTAFDDLGVKEAQVMSDREGNGMIFAMTADFNELVVRRQRNVLPDGLRKFHGWSRTGDVVKTLAVPVSAPRAPEAFLVSTEDRVLHLVEEVRGKSWHESVIAVPKLAEDKVESLTVHSVEVTALSAAGEPVPNATVVVKASRASAIAINGIVQQVDSIRGLTVRTDYSGRLVFKSRATDLTAPEVRLHVADFMPPGDFQSFDLAAALYRRLAGLDPKFPITPATLRAQKVLPSQSLMDDVKAGEVVKAVRRFGALAASGAGAFADPLWEEIGGLEAADGEPKVGWEFDFSNSSERMIVKPLSKAEVNRAFEGAGIVDGEILDLKQWLGDVLRRLGKAEKIADVAKVVVEVFKDGVKVLITLVKGVMQPIVVKGVAAIIGALEVLFDRIRAAYNMSIDFAKQAVDWLRQAFEWDDIVRTHHVILHVLTKQLDNFETLCSDDGKKILLHGATSLKDKLSGSLATAKKALGPSGAMAGKSLRDLYNPGGAVKDPILESRLFEAVNQNRTQSTYIFDLVETHSGVIADALPTHQIPPEDLQTFENFIDKVKKAMSDQGFQEKAEKMGAWFNNLSDPKKFVAAALSGLLDTIEVAVRRGVEVAHTVLEALLNLVAAAVKALRKMAAQPLKQIPVLSALYQQVTGKEMTLSGLISLGAAIPGTVLFKVMKGASPFTAEQAKQILANALPGGDADLLVNGPKADWSSESNVFAQLQKVLAFISGLLMVPYALMDMALDVKAALKAEVPKALLLVGNLTFLLLTVVTVALTTPFSQIFVADKDRTPNDKAAIIYYGISLLDVLLAEVLFHYSGKLTRQIEAIGGALSCVVGVVVGGTGLVAFIVAAAQSGKIAGTALADAVLAAIPRGAELTLSIPPLLGPKLAVALAAVDLVGDTAAGSCRLAG